MKMVALSFAVFAALPQWGCASGRVRGAQGTEMGQEREYEPESKVDPPVGNVMRTSGPIELPDPYPVLEVDLERAPKPPPKAEPEPGQDPE
jgi:hypothetical protein